MLKPRPILHLLSQAAGRPIAEKPEPKAKFPLPPESPILGNQGFDVLWSLWPRKVGKEYALKCYMKAVGRTPAEALLSTAKVQVELWKAEKREKQYVLHLSTWLNQNRCKDDDLQERPEAVEDEAEIPANPSSLSREDRAELIRKMLERDGKVVSLTEILEKIGKT